jgi:hypothetical protein
MKVLEMQMPFVVIIGREVVAGIGPRRTFCENRAPDFSGEMIDVRRSMADRE